MSLLTFEERNEYELIENFLIKNDWIIYRMDDNYLNDKNIFNILSNRIIDCIQYTVTKHDKKDYIIKGSNYKIYNLPTNRKYNIIIIKMFENMELIINSSLFYKHDKHLPLEIIIPIFSKVYDNIKIKIYSNFVFIYDCIIFQNKLENEFTKKKFYNQQKMYFNNENIIINKIKNSDEKLIKTKKYSCVIF